MIITASSVIKAYGPIGTVLQDGWVFPVGKGSRKSRGIRKPPRAQAGWTAALRAGSSVAALLGTAGETPCHLNLESSPEPP